MLRKYIITFRKESFSRMEVFATSKDLAKEMAIDLIEEDNLPEIETGDWEIYDMEDVT